MRSIHLPVGLRQFLPNASLAELPRRAISRLPLSRRQVGHRFLRADLDGLFQQPSVPVKETVPSAG